MITPLLLVDEIRVQIELAGYYSPCPTSTADEISGASIGLCLSCGGWPLLVDVWMAGTGG